MRSSLDERPSIDRRPYCQDALSVLMPLWTGGPLSQGAYLNTKPSLSGLWTGDPLSQEASLDRRPSQSASVSGQESLLVISPLWIGGFLSQEVSMDRRLSRKDAL